MGTRSLVCIVSDGKYAVDKYKKFNAAIDETGKEFAEILQKIDLDKLREKLKNIYKVSNLDYFHLIKKEFNTKFAWGPVHKILPEYRDGLSQIYPSLDNSISTEELIELIMSSENEKILIRPELESAKHFDMDYVYVADLDKDTFEVYKGHSKNPLSEQDRFFFNGYRDPWVGTYPAKLIGKCKIKSDISISSEMRILMKPLPHELIKQASEEKNSGSIPDACAQYIEFHKAIMEMN